MSKSACFGECPVYEISVDEDGLFQFHGKQNTAVEGELSRQLTNKELKKLSCKIKKAKFNKLDDQYGMNVTDVPVTHFTYHTDEFSKNIKVKTDMPRRLEKLEKELIELSPLNTNAHQTWNKIDMKYKTEQANAGRKESLEPTIIVELRVEADFHKWISKYRKYGVQLDKRIAPNRSLYVIRHDHSSIHYSKLIKLLNADQKVVTAELNEKVKLR
ncbi:DUF6438 domain-containing protein [Portibacter marinus]|uniref:DUF6438 domain-containing protein n=1 Tax=Portibacter marinus TaxID=2898660 RepID=UPI001F4004A9|nr:DUF6438 domain-containing protein [Portibacter marinus]